MVEIPGAQKSCGAANATAARRFGASRALGCAEEKCALAAACARRAHLPRPEPAPRAENRARAIAAGTARTFARDVDRSPAATSATGRESVAFPSVHNLLHIQGTRGANRTFAPAGHVLAFNWIRCLGAPPSESFPRMRRHGARHNRFCFVLRGLAPDRIQEFRGENSETANRFPTSSPARALLWNLDCCLSLQGVVRLSLSGDEHRE
jgi:hypothetical protein